MWGIGYGRGWGREFSGNPWPGRGPFSHLPPWYRPGWVFGRGACWRFFSPWLRSGFGAPTAAQGGYSYPPVWPSGYGYYHPLMGYPGYAQPPGELAREEEERVLGEELSALEARIEEIKKRLEELKK